MKTKTAESSQPVRLVRRSESDIREYAKSDAAKRTHERLLARGPDPTAKELAEMPELTKDELKTLVRRNKEPVTVRIDPDVVAWLRAKGGKYQQHLNAALRSEMEREQTIALRGGRRRMAKR